MSLLSVGASGLGNQSQILAKMLSRLDGSQATIADTSPKNAGTTTSTNSAAPVTGASTALTGTDQSRLSDQILALLVRLQQQTPASNSATTPNNGSAAGSGSTIGKPARALFSAMDSNGDGSVTQAEMETYIQRQGGTQSQADTLFTALSQKASSGISEHQMASDIAKGFSVRHHHHHAAAAPPSSPTDLASQQIFQGPPTDLASQQIFQGPPTDLASQQIFQGPPTDLASQQIFGGLDSNKNGTLSAAELNAAGLGTDPTLSTPSSGTSSSNAPNSLASLDSNGDGSVSANEFASFFSSLELQIQSDTATMANLMQKASQAYGSAANISRPANAMQSA
jgi:Ca2+-binding EF-hand superfamily protein